MREALAAAAAFTIFCALIYLTAKHTIVRNVSETLRPSMAVQR